MTAQPNPPPEPGLHAVETSYAPGEMTLMEHLLELRNRVLISAVALVLGSILCFVFWETILGWLLAPARDRFDDFKVFSFSPIDRIGVLFKIGLYGGAIVASPVIIYQVLAFILPGLTPKERKILLPGIAGVAFFLLGGMAFAYWIVLPASLGFLLDLGSDNFETATGAKQYIDFVVRIIFWVGVGFEVPMVLAVMARLRMATPKQMLSFWRYAIVIIAIVAAIITPTPDAYTLTLVAGPMLLLYFVGVAFAWLLYPRTKPAPAAV